MYDKEGSNNKRDKGDKTNAAFWSMLIRTDKREVNVCRFYPKFVIVLT